MPLLVVALCGPTLDNGPPVPGATSVPLLFLLI